MLTLGVYLFSIAEVVDHELTKLLLSIETDGAELDRYKAPIAALQCALHLSRRRSFGRQGFHQSAAAVIEFGRNEIEEIPTSHIDGGAFEHAQHCRIGQMDRPVGADNDHTVRRKVG